jgi:uncharacterized protein (TIGR00369 family)
MNETNTIESWNRQREHAEALMHAGGGRPGVPARGALAEKTGLQIMQGLLSGELPYPYMAQTMDVALIEVGHGRAVFQATPQLKHYNPMGVVHGGWFATLLDFALGCAVQTTLGAGSGYTTAQLNVYMVRAATVDAGPLRAIGTAVHSGRQMATSEARIVAPDGKLYAHATTTCLVFAAQAH